MNKTSLILLISTVSALTFLACGKNGEQESAQTPQQSYTYTQPTYDQNAYTTQPTTTTTTTTTTTATTASVMEGLAVPCTSDATCLTHRCNTALGRCTWPCQTNDDCQAGSQCISPLCVPAGFSTTQ